MAPSRWPGSAATLDTAGIVAKLWSAEYDHVTQVASVTTYFDSWPAAGGGLRVSVGATNCTCCPPMSSMRL